MCGLLLMMAIDYDDEEFSVKVINNNNDCKQGDVTLLL